MTLENKEIKKIIESYEKQKIKLKKITQNTKKNEIPNNKKIKQIIHYINIKNYNKELEKLKLLLRIITTNLTDISNYILRTTQNKLQTEQFQKEIANNNKKYKTQEKKIA